MPLRLIHLTDLHLANKPDWDPTDLIGRARNPLDPGHDPDAAKKLAALFKREHWVQSPDVRMLVSGDLTRTGDSTQFGCAHRLLHAEWAESTNVRYSLRADAGGSPTLTVPGNHDFWKGYDLVKKGEKVTYGVLLHLFAGVTSTAVTTLIPRMEKAIRGARFRKTPWLEVVPLLGGPARRLELIGLDSCSDLGKVGGLSPTWVKSKGRVSAEELKEAAQLIEQERQNSNELPFRVVVIHHPPSELDDAESQRFLTWVGKMKVEVILTGHTHKANWYTKRLPSGNSSVLVFDAGTALQYRSSSHAPKNRRDTERYNTFLEHALSLDTHGEVIWFCQMWGYHRSLQKWRVIRRLRLSVA